MPADLTVIIPVLDLRRHLVGAAIGARTLVGERGKALVGAMNPAGLRKPTWRDAVCARVATSGRCLEEIATLMFQTALKASLQRSRVTSTSCSPCAAETYQMPRPLSQMPDAIILPTSSR